MDEAPAGLHLRNEFATVGVTVDYRANGVRLALTDLRTGRVNYFDPLELEALVWVEHDELTEFMLPSRRWIDDTDWSDDDE
jgi:hypothetical protein